MESIIVLSLVMQLAPLASAQTINFADNFEDATIRIDYFHTAHATCDEITLDQIYINDTWAGNPNRLLPPMENGRYVIKVVDIASNKLIYSRHYVDIVFEYKSTDPAKAGRKRTYPHEEAEQLLNKTLEAQQGVLGNEHPHTLDSTNGFAGRWCMNRFPS